MPDEPNTTGTVEAPQQEQAAPATEAAPQQDGQHFDRILSKLDEIGNGVSQWQQAQPEPEAQPEPDQLEEILKSLGYDPSADQQGYDETDWQQQGQPDEFTLTPQDFAQAVMQASQQAVQAELAKSVHPQLAAQNEAALDTAFVDLEGRYPKLLEEEWQGKVLDSAQALAEQTGSADWLENPMLIELVHKSLLADELAAQETPVTATDEGLESPRGANPSSGDESDQDRADRIVAAGPNAALQAAGWFK